jgi:putative hemolysin
MGSSLSPLAILLATLFGAIFLASDAALFLLFRLGPVTFRRLAGGDGEERGKHAGRDPDDFALISGALLQIGLGGGVASTIWALWSYGAALALVVAVVIWIAAVILSKAALALTSDSLGEALLGGLIPVTRVLFYVFRPLIAPIRWTLRTTEERHEEKGEEEASEEEVQAYIDVGEEEGILEKSEAKLVQSIVDFGDSIAREIMTPRVDIDAFEVTRPVDDIAKLFSESKYSRIPVYEGSIDRIVGIVHVKDVFDVILRHETRSVRELARPAYIVSETKKVAELLREFQIEHLQLAIVVDEYGGTAGLISVEDLMEEIVGEISDEHEEPQESIVELEPDVYLVNGMTHVESIEELLGLQLSGDGYETVAGLMFTGMGRVPKPRQTYKKNGAIFEVDRADRRRIYRVRITRDPEWQGEREKREE